MAQLYTEEVNCESKNIHTHSACKLCGLTQYNAATRTTAVH